MSEQIFKQMKAIWELFWCMEKAVVFIFLLFLAEKLMSAVLNSYLLHQEVVFSWKAMIAGLYFGLLRLYDTIEKCENSAYCILKKRENRFLQFIPRDTCLFGKI